MNRLARSAFSSAACLLGLGSLEVGAQVPVTLHVESKVSQFGNVVDEQAQTAQGTTGSGAVELETLLLAAGYAYTTRTDPPDQPFVSAFSSDAGVFEVGVAGISLLNGADFDATSEQLFTVENPAPFEQPFFYEFEVFPMEVGAAFVNNQGSEEGPDFARGRLEGTYVHILANGTRRPPEDFFDYRIVVQPVNGDGPFDHMLSDDLFDLLDETTINDQGQLVPLVTLEEYSIAPDLAVGRYWETYGVRTNAFRRILHVLDLDVGESVEVSVKATASLVTRAEFGGIALVGDPFEIDLDFEPPVLHVPEPDAALLLAIGGLVLGFRAHQRRRLAS